MLSDEEKKAWDNLIMLKYFTMEKEDKQAIDTILNLIEKQQKEIEELKEKNNKYYYEWKHLEANMINKIKAKIEELKDGTYDAKIILQKLLEE